MDPTILEERVERLERRLGFAVRLLAPLVVILGVSTIYLFGQQWILRKEVAAQVDESAQIPARIRTRNLEIVTETGKTMIRLAAGTVDNQDSAEIVLIDDPDEELHPYSLHMWRGKDGHRQVTQYLGNEDGDTLQLSLDEEEPSVGFFPYPKAEDRTRSLRLRNRDGKLVFD